MSSATRRPALSCPAIVDAALELADRDGVDRLSMRRLGDALGVEAMSLYHHIPNKDRLLDLMVDAVFAEIERPIPGNPWRPALRQRCISLRAALQRHPWAVGLLDARSTPGPNTLRHHDAVLGCLRRGGFTVPQAARAFAVLDAYVFGFSIQESSIPVTEGDEVGALAEEILALADAGAYPYLEEIARDHVQLPGYRFGDEFEPGLDLVLDALARDRRARPARSVRPG